MTQKKASHSITTRITQAIAALAAFVITAMLIQSMQSKETTSFSVMETSVAEVHEAYKSGSLNAQQLVKMYLDRIEAYDQQGPTINCVITVNPKAMEEAARLDAAFKQSGPVGPLHGIPIILKDQMDVAGLPTTLGSLVFKDYVPTRDAFVVEKLKKAGAIILAKVTLGELGGGDTFGSLFGETHNPYDLERTVGGSSGGSGAAVTANFATIGVGQEGFASIRRPSTWNSIVGMRPTAGLVSRAGVWGGWPSTNGSLGPMARTVTDLAKLLDVMVGYDPEDPITALGVGHTPDSYTKSLVKDGLKGARIGILRETFGGDSEPDSQDFKNVTAVFDKAISELKTAGAEVVDPIVIPNLNELLAKRASSAADSGASTKQYLARNPNSPYKTMEDIRNAPDYSKVVRNRPGRSGSAIRSGDGNAHYEYMMAREELMLNVMKVMADYKLDAIVHKSVEHTPTLIKDGINPPYVNHKGAPHLNTFLIYVASIAVPAGFTSDNLPVGITFFGRPYSEPTMIKFAYAYEQATHHRKPPPTTPALKVIASGD
jgi:Asp-tRNA(Asn)/Glu-tRNA(Gln) amidotransferase A subunit family amidase